MIPWLDADEPFPALSTALPPDSPAPGLLAATVTLTPTRLLHAYRQGIFPWYSSGEPVLWWSPDPRMVLIPAQFRVSASLRKTLRRFVADPDAEIRVNADFDGVIRACAAKPRPGQQGTWITPAVIDAYGALHAAGYAYSVETWHRGARTGGLYGVAIGAMCYGESMYADRTDASKIALAALCAFAAQAGVAMIDCQQQTRHLASLGAAPMPRDEFADQIRHATALPDPAWCFDKRVLQHWLDAPHSSTMPSPRSAKPF